MIRDKIGSGKVAEAWFLLKKQNPTYSKVVGHLTCEVNKCGWQNKKKRTIRTHTHSI